MHCELWKVRTSSNVGYDDLRFTSQPVSAVKIGPRYYSPVSLVLITNVAGTYNFVNLHK